MGKIATLGVALSLCVLSSQAQEAPSCSYSVSTSNIASLASGKLPEGVAETNSGDCVMQLQKTALEDQIALEACPDHFRVRSDNSGAYDILVSLPVQKAESKYGKIYAQDREKLRKSFTLAGCDKRAETYFPFYAKDKSTFIERVR